jgi:hypothetical protein
MASSFQQGLARYHANCTHLYSTPTTVNNSYGTVLHEADKEIESWQAVVCSIVYQFLACSKPIQLSAHDLHCTVHFFGCNNGKQELNKYI